MEKKLRITVPAEIYKIIESDLEDSELRKIICATIFLKTVRDLNRYTIINMEM